MLPKKEPIFIQIECFECWRLDQFPQIPKAFSHLRCQGWKAKICLFIRRTFRLPNASNRMWVPELRQFKTSQKWLPSFTCSSASLYRRFKILAQSESFRQKAHQRWSCRLETRSLMHRMPPTPLLHLFRLNLFARWCCAAVQPHSQASNCFIRQLW